MAEEFKDLQEIIQADLREAKNKRSALKDLDFFVLDNSLRESTVGQLRGHTLENKWAILKEVEKCGFQHIIVSAFSHATRVDDVFVEQLCKERKDKSCYYAFSEIGEGKDLANMPVGLKKMEKFGLQNPIFEVNLSNGIGTQRVKDLLQKWITYTYDKLARDAKILVNLRDFPFAMSKCSTHVFDMVKFLGSMPEGVRPFGIIFEEPTGRFLPETLSGWTKAIRKLMDQCNWQSGHLLVHIHKKWCFAEVTQLECLSSGANGVWASVCEEGAALGHACSTVSLMNLVRLGNKKVLKKYNCNYLRDAAINVTKITTSAPPAPMQPIYGERALDVAFDFDGIAGGQLEENEFDMAKFFGVKAPTRISSLAGPSLILQKLKEFFGEDKQFTEEMAIKMQAQIVEDLAKNEKEEYMSYVGLALLFDKAGGSLTAEMSEATEKDKLENSRHEELIKQVREIWDKWDLTEDAENVGDNCLEFYSFYNGFMAPYFGCYECENSRKGLQAIDMDEDGKVDWAEFCLYLRWALRQHPEISTCEQLLATAFQKGLIPAMQDEIIKQLA